MAHARLFFAVLFVACLMLAGCGGSQVKAEVEGERAVTESVRSQADTDGVAAGVDDEPAAQFDDEFDEEFDDEFDDPFAEEEGGGDDSSITEIADPFEPLNRGTTWVNNQLFLYILNPLVKGYRFVIPEPARHSIKNFFTNITTPVRVVSAALQFKFEDATTETLRFITNSTVGIFGLFDVARDYGGLSKKDEDMGQTLGHYGVGNGFYFVLPLLGPTTLRDGVGKLVDTFIIDPTNYLGFQTLENVVYVGADKMNALSFEADSIEAIIKQSIDPYLTMKNGYLQLRAAKVAK